MERSTKFNIFYLLFAVFAMFAVQEDRIAEVTVSDQHITGKLKKPEGSKTVKLLDKETLAEAELDELRKTVVMPA